MSRRHSLSGADDEIELNISPLIDMVFILLIFFIVTTVFVEEEGLDVDKPQPAAELTLEKDTIIFHITNNGAILFDGVQIGLSGVRPAVRRMSRREELPVILEVEHQAPSGIMVRVMDEAKLAGALAVSIAAARR